MPTLYLGQRQPQDFHLCSRAGDTLMFNAEEGQDVKRSAALPMVAVKKKGKEKKKGEKKEGKRG